MSVPLVRGEIKVILNRSKTDPVRELYNDVIASIRDNDVVALKDALEKGLKERGVGGHSAIKQLLNSLDFAPLKVVQLMSSEDHGKCCTTVSLPLVVSCIFGHHNCTALLLERYGADPNLQDGTLPLIWCCLYGLDNCAELLLNNGADPNGKDKDDDTFPLTVAVFAHNQGQPGSLRAIRLLLESGAEVDLNTSKTDRKTALFMACKYGSHDAVELLLIHGADVNKKAPSDGTTALHAAVHSNHLDIVRMLVDKKANVNEQEEDGLTCLHFAALGNFHEVITFLLQHGAQVDLTCRSFDGEPLNSGATPLLLAVKRNHIESMYETPWSVSKANSFRECARMLENSIDFCSDAQEPEDMFNQGFDAEGFETLSVEQQKSLIMRMIHLECLSEMSEPPEYVLQQTNEKVSKVQLRAKASTDTDETSRPGPSSGAARPSSSPASSTSAKKANDVSRTSSSSAAAQPSPSLTASDPVFQARSHSVAAGDSGGGPNELPTPSDAAAQPHAPRHAVKACLWCGAAGKRLKCCSGCGAVWLCGQDCQRQSWPGHRAMCKEAQRHAVAEKQRERKQES